MSRLLDLAQGLVAQGFEAESFRGIKLSALLPLLVTEKALSEAREDLIIDARANRIKPDRSACYFQVSGYAKRLPLWEVHLNSKLSIAWTVRITSIWSGVKLDGYEHERYEYDKVKKVEFKCLNPAAERVVGGEFHVKWPDSVHFPNSAQHHSPLMFDTWDIWLLGDYLPKWEALFDTAVELPLISLTESDSDVTASKQTQNFFQMAATAGALKNLTTRNENTTSQLREAIH